MGKYNSLGDRDYYLHAIAKELAEANRLKRIEMKHHDWRLNPADKEYPVHDLEDQV